VKRLRAICRETLSQENYRVAHKWNERAMWLWLLKN
jgi:hypothetical protein